MQVLGWPALRLKCLERDDYTCKLCGFKPEIPEVYKTTFPHQIDSFKSSNFVADHIKPIALGGDEWDINNLQTLCLLCNKKKTRQDIIEIGIETKREAREDRTEIIGGGMMDNINTAEYWDGIYKLEGKSIVTGKQIGRAHV